jgi:OOP family OmpA-OmpF porin
MKRLFFSMLSATFLALNVSAQETDVDTTESEVIEPSVWSVGLNFGPRTNFMKFTNLSPDINGTKTARSNFVFSVFAYREFKDGKYGIRPQLSLLSRGAKYTGIESKYWENATYDVKANYLDLRMPLILNLNEFEISGQPIQPYVYITPILGAATGGELSLTDETEDPEDAVTISMDAAKSNLASFYLGAGLGVGARYKFDIMGEKCFVGFEMMFDYGISNTYGKNEKDGKAEDVGYLVNYTNYPLDGKRRFSGLEFQVTACVPMSLFKHKRKKKEPPVIEEVIIDEPIHEPEKPCYELEEISQMIADGKSVKGKTICAINTINFDFGSAKIKEESFDYLNKLAEILKSTGANIKVNGHTDSIGTVEYNLKLSRDRAKSVVNYLTNKGIAKEKLSSEGYGPNRPLTTNETDEGRAMNRRVEFEILDEE